MGKTARIGLPLVAGGQAQKHVTVNESLARIDAMTGLVLESTGVLVPPVAPDPGACYAVPAGATGAWAAEAGRVAIFVNEGWDFLAPPLGVRAFVLDEAAAMRFDGTDWVVEPVAEAMFGAATVARVIEASHTVTAGPISDTTQLIPSGAVVMGVSGRVTSDFTGSALGFSLGIAGGSADLFGAGLPTAAGASFQAVPTSPAGFAVANGLRLSGEGGDLGSGSVRLAVHVLEITPPQA